MNWDWDKLQEKRNKQVGNKPRPSGQNDDRGNESDPNDNQDDPRKRWTTRDGGRGPSGRNPLGDTFRKINTSGLRPFHILSILAALFIVWMASGIFIVEPDEVGMVLRFGAFKRQAPPGPHYRLPYPIETVETPKVTAVRQIEIGTSANSRSNKESAMLTGDENIVNVQFIVQFTVKDPAAFLFNAELYNKMGQPEYIRMAAEAAMREVIGKTQIDPALTDGKTEIQSNTQDLLQNILDHYQSGIEIKAVQMKDVYPPEQVSNAFKDVTSAREDRARTINQAEAYRNQIVPATRGEAAEILNQAEAYRQSVVHKAEGEAQRFTAILTQYEKAPLVTKKRMYLEAMEEMLSNPDLEKIIMPKGSGVVPYLPLDRLNPSVNSKGAK